MTNNVAEIPINVPETTDNVPKKRGRGRPRSGKVVKYWGEGAYYNVTLRLDPELKESLKAMAKKEGTSAGRLASEAITAWMKWMVKREREERGWGPEGKEFRKADELLKQRNREIYLERMKEGKERKHGRMVAKALRCVTYWRKLYPGVPWPGGKKGKVDNVAEKIVPQI